MPVDVVSPKFDGVAAKFLERVDQHQIFALGVYAGALGRTSIPCPANFDPTVGGIDV